MASAKKNTVPASELDEAVRPDETGTFADDNTTRKRGTRRNAGLTDTDYVNEQLNRVLFALDAFKKGDVSVRLTKQNDDIFSEIAEAYNSMV
ncbi:MAG: hypothetical protein EOO62_14095, partial [Hymenobacter sp.]